MEHVLWIDALDDDAGARVGSKVANLAKLRRMGLRVPDGFAVSTATYERFCRDSGIASEIEAAVATIDPGDEAGVERASAVIRAAFRSRNHAARHRRGCRRGVRRTGIPLPRPRRAGRSTGVRRPARMAAAKVSPGSSIRISGFRERSPCSTACSAAGARCLPRERYNTG